MKRHHRPHPQQPASRPALLERINANAAGIAVLTDSDDTRSSAQGDYANFRACGR